VVMSHNSLPLGTCRELRLIIPSPWPAIATDQSRFYKQQLQYIHSAVTYSHWRNCEVLACNWTAQFREPLHW